MVNSVKNVLIIGGTGLIGSNLTERFLNEKCKIVVTGSKTNLARSLSDMITYIQLDITDIKSFDIFFDRLLEVFSYVDVLIYSVGVHMSVKYTHISEEEFNSCIGTGIKGLYFFIQKFVRFYSNKRKCKIIVINSIAAFLPAITPNQISKWAMRGFVKGISQEIQAEGFDIWGVAPHRIVSVPKNENETGIDSLVDIIFKIIRSDIVSEKGDTIIC